MNTKALKAVLGVWLSVAILTVGALKFKALVASGPPYVGAIAIGLVFFIALSWLLYSAAAEYSFDGNLPTQRGAFEIRPRMITIHGQTWFFDVDDTLVLWGKKDHPDCIVFDNYGYAERLLPHFEHIEMLKKAKARGHKVIVWSAGGSEWAKSVVKTLALERYVDLVISKPTYFIDDLKPEVFMPESNHIYIKPKD